MAGVVLPRSPGGSRGRTRRSAGARLPGRRRSRFQFAGSHHRPPAAQDRAWHDRDDTGPGLSAHGSSGMKVRPSSLSRRLLFGAAIFITVALVVAGGFIGFALRRFITGQIDQRLDSQIISVASAIETGPRGQLQLTRDVDGPPFNRQESGWYWQVLGTNLKSRSLGAENLTPDLNKERPDETRPFPADHAGPSDDPLHLRIQRRRIAASTVTIAVSAPRAALNRPLREAMTTLAISLGVLGLALLLAIFLQVRLGLRPLNRLRADLADVAAGRIQRVPAEQPEEVRPVVAEMNSLLDQNAEGLARARRHVANLAHGLKTPLTTLSLALAEPGRELGRDHV